jgi:hypothetical protein
MRIKNYLLPLAFALSSLSFQAQGLKLGLLVYNGGGDWYANLATSLPNLIAFCNQNMRMQLDPEQAIVEAGSPDIFNYPFVHMTGHGNVIFTDTEAQNLRKYLLSGGFLHVDDNYGMDQFVRRELKKVFPTEELTELPPSHPIFQQQYRFEKGIPKIHEHEQGRPQALGIVHDGRLVLLYTFETDLGDGWESAEVHGNSEETRRKALQMGANIVRYVLLAADPDSEM